MNDKKKLMKAGSLYFVGNIFDKAISFITIPIFTRMLSVSEYGVTNTYLSWVSILSVIITLSLGNSIRTAVIDYPREKNEYMSSIFILGSISALILTTLLCILTNLSGSNISLKLVLFCCINAYANSILSAVQLRYMMDVKYLQRTLLQSLPNILIILLSIVFILNLEGDRYLGRIYSYVLINSIIAVLYVVYYLMKGKVLYCEKYWRYSLSFSIPIIFHSLSTVILSQVDRTMLTWLRGAAETGRYSLAYQFGMIPLVITTTLENIWIPWFTLKMGENDKNSINKMVKPYIGSVSGICILVMLITPEVLINMTTKDYYSARYMIVPVIIATYLMFLTSISLDLEYYLKKTKGIAINTIVAAIINIILNFVFIPIYGGVAAAYSTTISYAVSFVIHYVVARKLDKKLFHVKIYLPWIILVSGFGVLVFWLMDFVILRWGIAIIIASILAGIGLKFVSIRRDNKSI